MTQTCAGVHTHADADPSVITIERVCEGARGFALASVYVVMLHQYRAGTFAEPLWHGRQHIYTPCWHLHTALRSCSPSTHLSPRSAGNRTAELMRSRHTGPLLHHGYRFCEATRLQRRNATRCSAFSSTGTSLLELSVLCGLPRHASMRGRSVAYLDRVYDGPERHEFIRCM